MNNVIDLMVYRRERGQLVQTSRISDELEDAIQHLIQRLREHNPVA